MFGDETGYGIGPGMGFGWLIGLLVLVFPVLGIAEPIKFLRF